MFVSDCCYINLFAAVCYCHALLLVMPQAGDAANHVGGRSA